MRSLTPADDTSFDETLRLLLMCARTAWEPAGRSRIAPENADAIEWSRLVELSERHALLPLAHRALAGEAAVPRTIQVELAGKYLARTARNLLLAHTLRELLVEFEREGIAVFVHKGLAIGALAYGDVSLRHAGDLDVVIRRGDLARASRLLAKLGYHAKAGAPDERGYHLGFSRREPEVVVELHWAFTSARWPFLIDEERLWSSLTSVPVAGIAVPCLEPAMAVLALCAHGTKEGWDRLGLVVDLAALLTRYPDLPWGWVLERAREMGRERAVLLGLALASACLGVEVPKAVRERLAQVPALRQLCRQVMESYQDGQPIKGLSFHWFMGRVIEKWADRALYFSHVAPLILGKFPAWLRPSDADYRLCRRIGLPAILSYGIRPVRILHSHGGAWMSLKSMVRRMG